MHDKSQTFDHSAAQDYHSALSAMSPATAWHTLYLATVECPEQLPPDMAWKVPVLRGHLILVEASGHRFLSDPAVIGLKPGTEEHRAWMLRSVRFERLSPHDTNDHLKPACAQLTR